MQNRGGYPPKQFFDLLSRNSDLLVMLNESLRALASGQPLTPQQEQALALPLAGRSGYDIQAIPLDTAKTDYEVSAVGNYLNATTDGDLTNISVKLNSPSNKAISLADWGGIPGIGFNKLYLSWTAQSGKTLTLFIGQGLGIQVAPRMVDVNIIAQALASVDVNIVTQALASLVIKIGAAQTVSVDGFADFNSTQGNAKAITGSRTGGTYENNATAASTSQIHGANWCAQTFTPAVQHIITSADLLVDRSGSPGAVTVSIRATDGNGHPTGLDLCSGMFDGDALGGYPSPAWQNVNFGAGLTLNAGTKYAIVVRAAGGDISNYLDWYRNGANPYAGGNRENSADSSGTWAAVAADDFGFRDKGPGILASYTVTGGKTFYVSKWGGSGDLACKYSLNVNMVALQSYDVAINTPLSDFLEPKMPETGGTVITVTATQGDSNQATGNIMGVEV